ncbi:peptidase M24 [Gemmatirosa kalamazoonensis]|uniref:Peptidase M24 n=1 Tax=Gemmatirosa kalamazoonensis TaxID=861299 RepID=W0RGZ3_9BACT|nr:M24 family metallopeptidase [Gemmatirosa kalamazoonensis]AHG89605.1 peptidase M24 [Gemmatirosa kalamazoonensis]
MTRPSRVPPVFVALASLVLATAAPAARAQDAVPADTQPAGRSLAELGLTATPTHPFGTLREQAAAQQRWLAERMRAVLPALLRKYDVDAWVVPMREYNEDPVFSSLVSPETFAARRRTIYAFFAPCDTCRVERLAFGGTSQGGVYEAVRATKAVPTAPGLTVAAGSGARAPTAELWGDEQWQVLKRALETRRPRRIAVDVSRTFAFADGLSAGELEGMHAALGTAWTSRFVHVDGLPLDLIATRSAEEDALFREMNRLVWDIVGEAFSNRVVTPGTTRTSDVVWWMRQRVNDLGLGTWFHPSVEVQRRGWTAERLGDDPVIERGDVLHCDFGITALRLNTDTQHMGYVLRDGETEPPAGLRAALGVSNRLQDILVAELRPGRTGNEILRAAQARMRSAGIDGTIYTHPIGMHGHGAGPLIGLWDYQDGVPGRGDARVIPRSWYSIELQATTPVPEWDGQPVRSAQEEDLVIGADGIGRWAYRRQTAFHLVR